MCKTETTELGQVEYSVRGVGTPLVFFHGGHSSCKETVFQKGFDPSRYMLITPSRPGYGKTPLLKNTTPRKTADLIERLLGSLGIEKAGVVGISAGGLPAIEYAARYPGNTTCLILISAVTRKWLDQNDALYRRGMKMFSPKRENLSWKLFRTFFRLFPNTMTKTLFNELSTVKDPSFTSGEIEQIKEMTFRQASGTGFVADLNHSLGAKTIQNVRCPTLILHSENDKSVPLEMAYYAEESIENSILKTYKNKWGHLLWVGEDSKAPIQDTNDFLEQYSA